MEYENDYFNFFLLRALYSIGDSGPNEQVLKQGNSSHLVTLIIAKSRVPNSYLSPFDRGLSLIP